METGKIVGILSKQSEVTATEIDTGPNCGTCPFWFPNATLGEGGGECRKNSPKVFALQGQTKLGQIGIQLQTLYPSTPSVAWCGEHPERKLKES